jgi:hypothetical protein
MVVLALDYGFQVFGNTPLIMSLTLIIYQWVFGFYVDSHFRAFEITWPMAWV